MLQWGLYAAALRLPFLPTRAGLGTDVMTVNPHIKTVKSPYADGEELVAVPAIELDVAMWRQLNLMWVGNFAFLGAANLYVVYRFDEATWVNFKLFGMLGLTLLMAIGQALWIAFKTSSEQPEEG